MEESVGSELEGSAAMLRELFYEADLGRCDPEVPD